MATHPSPSRYADRMAGRGEGEKEHQGDDNHRRGEVPSRSGGATALALRRGGGAGHGSFTLHACCLSTSGSRGSGAAFGAGGTRRRAERVSYAAARLTSESSEGNVGRWEGEGSGRVGFRAAGHQPREERRPVKGARRRRLAPQKPNLDSVFGLRSGFSLNGCRRQDNHTLTLLGPHPRRALGIGPGERASEIETRWTTSKPSRGNCWSKGRSPSLSAVNFSQADSVPPTAGRGRTHPRRWSPGLSSVGKVTVSRASGIDPSGESMSFAQFAVAGPVSRALGRARWARVGAPCH